jgi:hypothetical protein
LKIKIVYKTKEHNLPQYPRPKHKPLERHCGKGKFAGDNTCKGIDIAEKEVPLPDCAMQAGKFIFCFIVEDKNCL